MASVIGLVPSQVDEYQRLHRAVWDEVLAQIHAVNIRNYSIFLRQMPDGKHYLFSYYEYHGTDHAADMARMAQDPATQRWWKLCDPCQETLPDIAPGEKWAPMKEVFHTD